MWTWTLNLLTRASSCTIETQLGGDYIIHPRFVSLHCPAAPGQRLYRGLKPSGQAT